MTLKNKVYMTGFMGSGKTTAGRKIAANLGWKYVDLDLFIEKEHGKSIPEIFSEKGEEYFRKAEYAALREFDDQSGIVIATGGGAPCFSDNMDHMLSHGIVVYLKLTPEQLSSRLKGGKAERPLIMKLNDEELPSYIAGKLNDREPFYSRAHITVQGFDLDLPFLLSTIRKMVPEVL